MRSRLEKFRGLSHAKAERLIERVVDDHLAHLGEAYQPECWSAPTIMDPDKFAKLEAAMGRRQETTTDDEGRERRLSKKELEKRRNIMGERSEEEEMEEEMRILESQRQRAKELGMTELERRYGRGYKEDEE